MPQKDLTIFLSWSGPASQAAAQAIGRAIEDVFSDARPWISSKDIQLGQEWFTELRGALETTRFAVACLTRRNAASPWVLFEAGAVAGKLQGLKLVTVLLEGDVTDLVDPMARFNNTRFDHDGMLRLFESINISLGTPMKPLALQAAFEAVGRRSTPRCAPPCAASPSTTSSCRCRWPPSRPRRNTRPSAPTR